MFNPSSAAASAFADHLEETYLTYFSDKTPEYADYVGSIARLVLERFGNSDALYHNAEHTMMVTLVGQQIMLGRLLSEPIRPTDWLHFTVALLVHDVGYTRGICSGDGHGVVVINKEGDTIIPPRGASDAILAPYHVDRGILFVQERFADSDLIDASRLAKAIELTRFPVPEGSHYSDTDGEPALVRAADLIGQMADPFYHRKIGALYHEFVEVGLAAELGYDSPIDLIEQYPEFFWSQVQPLIGTALRYLEQTVEGKQWVAQLFNHVFQVEHRTRYLGPFPGPARS